MKNSQLHLSGEKPYAVIIGKGNKIRTLYLLPRAVAHLRRYLAEFHGETPDPEAYIFYSRNTGCHGKLTQPAISKMLRKYAKAAHEVCSDVPLASPFEGFTLAGGRDEHRTDFIPARP